MNFLKKGPELKLSEIKVPGFLEDVYYDLKERHLLPIAALLIVGIVAAPIVLAESGGEEPSLGGAAVGGAAASTASADSGQLVAKSAPGLRDFHRRLEHRQEQDPFQQQYSEPKTEGAETGGSAGGSSGAEEYVPSSPPIGPETGGGEEGEPDPDRLTYYSYAIDVRVSGGGEEGSTKATVRRNLPELTMLPSRQKPAIVYMGSTKDGKKAVMTVSSDVDSIFGDAKCALGSERCELLVMEEGLPETFVFGDTGKAYRIELVKIHLVKTDELNRAPLGKPPKNKGKGKDKNAG